MATSERLDRRGGPVRSLIRLLVAAAREWSDDRAIRLGAAVAYYALFALIPVITLAIGLASIFFDQELVSSEVSAAISELLGDELAEAVIRAFELSEPAGPGGVLSLVSFGILLFTGALLFVAWKDVVDIIYEAPRVSGARGTVQRRLFGVLAVLGAGVLLTLNLMAEAIVAILSGRFDTALADIVWTTTGSVLPMALGALFIGILYKYTPEEEVDWADVWFASVVTMLLLAVGAWAYGVYLDRFGFASASGVAGSVLLGLVLVYYAVNILLYGVEIVKLKHRGLA